MTKMIMKKHTLNEMKIFSCQFIPTSWSRSACVLSDSDSLISHPKARVATITGTMFSLHCRRENELTHFILLLTLPDYSFLLPFLYLSFFTKKEEKAKKKKSDYVPGKQIGSIILFPKVKFL